MSKQKFVYSFLNLPPLEDQFSETNTPLWIYIPLDLHSVIVTIFVGEVDTNLFGSHW